MRTLILLFFFVSSLNFFGQERLDLFSLNTRFKPSTETSNGFERFEERGINMNLKIPIVRENKDIFYNEINAFHYRFSNETPGANPMPRQLNLSAFFLRVGYIKQLSKDRTIDLFVMPRFMTDFKNVSGDQLQLGGIFSLSKKYSERFMLRLGILFNQDEFGPFFNPLINIYWQMSPKFTFTSSLPFLSRITYQVNEKNQFGLYHFSPITSYNLGAYPEEYIERVVIDVGAFYRRNLTGNFFLEGRIGRNFGHHYGMYNRSSVADWKISLIESGDRKVSRDLAIGDHYFAELKFIYSIPVPQ